MPGQEPNPFLGFHHVAIIASDIERSLLFYTTVFGLKVVAREYRRERDSWKIDLALPGGGSQIELFSFPGAPPRPNNPEARGLRHLAFRVASMDAMLLHLQRHSIPVEPVRLDQATNRRYTFFKDPDGLPIEAYED